MNIQWQYLAWWEKEQLGPIPASDLLRAIDSGRVPQNAVIRAKGDTSWQPLAEVQAALREAAALSFEINVSGQIDGPLLPQQLLIRVIDGAVPNGALVRTMSSQTWQPLPNVLAALGAPGWEHVSPTQGADAAYRPTPRQKSEPVADSKTSPPVADDPAGYRDNYPKQDIAEAEKQLSTAPAIVLAQGPTSTSTLHLRGADGISGANGQAGRPGSNGERLPDVYDQKGNKRTVYGRGGNGTAGWSGERGRDGQHGRGSQLSLYRAGDAVHITGASDQLTFPGNIAIDARGGQGGNGGNGGSGGAGGWGSPSGRRGPDGAGGDGGNGGNGGNVRISTTDAHLLALITSVQVAAGLGGNGGAGSPGGSGGNYGRVGSFSCSFQLPDSNRVEEGTTIGLNPIQITFADDGTRLGGMFTRSSKFQVTSVTLRNDGDFSILAPYFLALGSEAPVDLDTDSVLVTDTVLPVHGTEKLACSVNATIRTIADIGHYRIRVAAFSRRGALTIPLNKDRQDGVFPVSVNHRLVPSEISVSNADEGSRVEALAEHWNAQPPERQSGFFTAIVLTAASRGAKLSSARQAELNSALAGPLLDMDDVWAHSGKTELMGEGPLAAATHFFAAMPYDNRSKVMDAAYFITTANHVIDQQEKELLRRLAQNIGFDEEWLFEHMPKLLEKGASKVRATATNWPSLLSFPFAIVGIFLICEATVAFATSSPERLDFQHDAGWFSLAIVILVPNLFAFRRFGYRTACRICQSLNLKAVEHRSLKGSLVSTADAFRCVDCGARGNQLEGDEAELIAADCGLAASTGFPLRVPLVTGALLLSGIALSSAVAPVSDPHTYLFGLVLLFVLSLISGLLTHKARRITRKVVGWVTALSVLFAIGNVGRTYSEQQLRDKALAFFYPRDEPSSVSTTTAPHSSASAASAPGTAAIIGNTGGQGVFLGRTANPHDNIRMLPDGIKVTITGRTAYNGTIEWLEIQSPLGQGWVPAKHVVR